MAQSDDQRLLVSIEARTKDIEKAMARVKRESDKAAAAVEKRWKGVDRTFGRLKGLSGAFAGGFAGGVLGGLASTSTLRTIRETVKTVADLGDLADRIGLSAEALQKLGYAAGQSGVDTETLNKALERFAKNLSAASRGEGKLADVFQDAGIAIVDTQGQAHGSELGLTRVPD